MRRVRRRLTIEDDDDDDDDDDDADEAEPPGLADAVLAASAMMGSSYVVAGSQTSWFAFSPDVALSSSPTFVADSANLRRLSIKKKLL